MHPRAIGHTKGPVKKFAKILAVGVLAIVLLLVVLGTWLVYLAKTRLPVLDAVIAHPSLRSEVRVVRDDWGVPHIQAENEPDAYFALGYVVAQDRLFQMELVLRLARGELAELLGPPLVPIDKIARSFRVRAKAEEFFAEANRLPSAGLQATEAFVAGINHRVQKEPLPFEFTVLGIPARTYTPVDCLTICAILPIAFADGLRGDVVVSVLKERHPDLDIHALFPGYGNEIPVTIMETLDEAEAYLKEKARLNPLAGKAALPGNGGALEDLLAALQSISDLFGPALGSNSWVLGPSRTKSGKSILANDPHMGLLNPSVWYEAHIKLGDFDIYGYYLPLIPFALLGHNRRHAWAMTMFPNDDMDLYRETFHPDDPNKVMYKGEWVDVQTETSTIKVRFWHDQKCTVRITPHGPIITDLFRRVHGYEGADVSMSWMWQHVEYTDTQAIYRLGHARNYDDFAQAVSLFTSPGINVSYADREGNIAWWAAGKIPIRPKHVNPKELLDGASGKDEVLGYVPFEQNPHLKNPECGYIVTANNMSTVKPVGPLDELQGYWQPTDRAGRIEHLLEQRNDWTIEALKAVQLDDTAHAAPAIVERVTETLEGFRQEFSPLERQALSELRSWDYRHNVESTGAAIYQVLCHSILENALEDEMGEDLFRMYCTMADHWNFFKYLVQQGDSPYCDDINTPGKERFVDILLRSFRDTVVLLEEKLGSDVAQWNWGRLHTMEFKHPFGYLPLLGRIFNIGPFPSSGGNQLINSMLYRGDGHRYAVVAGPSTRRLIDFADPEHSLTILPPGNSGNVISPHYDDQAEMFMKGGYREPRITDEQIEAHNMHEMRFIPAR